MASGRPEVGSLIIGMMVNGYIGSQLDDSPDTSTTNTTTSGVKQTTTPADSRLPQAKSMADRVP